MPWTRSIRVRTATGPHTVVMPPWFVEGDLGIQKFKNDPSFTDEEVGGAWRESLSDSPRSQGGVR